MHAQIAQLVMYIAEVFYIRLRKVQNTDYTNDLLTRWEQDEYKLGKNIQEHHIYKENEVSYLQRKIES